MNHPLIDRLLRLRAQYEARGDRSLVREIDVKLRMEGYRPDASPAVLERVEERLEAQVKPRRGRPPIRRDLPPVPPEAA